MTIRLCCTEKERIGGDIGPVEIGPDEIGPVEIGPYEIGPLLKYF